MGHKEKAAAALAITGTGGLGFGGQFASQSKSNVEEGLEELYLSSVQPLIENQQSSQAISQPRTSSNGKPNTKGVSTFGEDVVGKLAASRHGGIVTDTRPTFDPSPVDFGTVTASDVYIDMAHASNKKT